MSYGNICIGSFIRKWYKTEPSFVSYGGVNLDKFYPTKIQTKYDAVFSSRLDEQTGIKNFCLAGGVALNCDMNAKISELPFVDNLFIQPASNDAGTAVGAALEVAHNLGEPADFKMEHAHWGPEFSNSEIEKTLNEAKVRFRKVTDIEETVAKELEEGKIVGWFQGRSELGPRALGNRSILAHPGIRGMKDKINKEVKHRESWRPFAPSILHEDGEKYFENYVESPFMLLTFFSISTSFSLSICPPPVNASNNF